ncbi:MAG: PrsW family intramembrane metalloprotease [Firmicutes bacterium]|nr:PrsW family intramembrane metalloprotease [Bacillota bacterium]
MENTLLFLALLPGIIIIIFIFRKDKVEHEPMGLIFKLVLFGAISCIPAMFLEMGMGGLNPGFKEGTVEFAVFEAFAVAALCEEICKFVLLRLGSWRNRNFDYRFDGIVYGVCVAVGFALLENVLYVMSSGLETAVMRGILAVPLHAFCGVFMGVFYGAAKKASIEGNHGKALSNTVKALIIPMLIHGFYDMLAFMQTTTSSIILLVFVGFMYIVAVKCVNRYSKDDWKAAFYYNSGEFNENLGRLSVDDNNEDDISQWHYRP